MPDHIVSATQLNLRSTPAVATGNIIAALPNGQTVTDLDRTLAPWWKVRTTFHGQVLEGFVNSNFLAAPSAAPTESAIAPVHLGERAAAIPSSTGARAFAIGDPAAPRRRAASLT